MKLSTPSRGLRIVARQAIVLSIAVLLTGTVRAAQPPRLSSLATEPDWAQLQQYQETITRDEFTTLLLTVYALGDAAHGTVDIEPDGAHILTSGTHKWLLRFSNTPKPLPKSARYWHPITHKSSAGYTTSPLAGISIALDPGHLGGPWAKMEERWFQIGPGTTPVTEGDMTLLTARLLAQRLTAAGAQVSMVRDSPLPLTRLRPADLITKARTQLQQQGLRIIRDHYDGPTDPLKMNSVQWASELLFYRTAEIRARAQRVNSRLQPDLVLCLHFNAEAWGDPGHPRFVPRNHMHILVNGSYAKQELALDDVRFEMLEKLLSRSYPEELMVGRSVAGSLAAATGLPPYQYTTGNANRQGDNPYLWSRNLLANRLYQCPTVYIEPYVMNSQEVWERVQAGDYEGRKLVAGKVRESIYREYANAVADGVIAAAAVRAP